MPQAKLSCPEPDERISISICVLAECQNSDSFQQDLQIQPWRPVLDVIEIVRNASVRLLERVDFAPKTIDLSPAGDAWFDAMAMEILLDRVAIEAIAGFHCHRVGARANQRHIAAQHIDQLRQFV